MAMAICHLIKHIDIAHCQVGETHAWWATPISFIPLLYHPPRISQNSKHCHGRMSCSCGSPWRLKTFVLWRAVLITLLCLVLAVHIWKTPKGATIQYSDWLFQPSWKWDVTKAPENKRSSQLAWVKKVIVNIVICVCEGLTAIEQTFAVAFGWG